MSVRGLVKTCQVAQYAAIASWGIFGAVVAIHPTAEPWVVPVLVILLVKATILTAAACVVHASLRVAVREHVQFEALVQLYTAQETPTHK